MRTSSDFGPIPESLLVKVKSIHKFGEDDQIQSDLLLPGNVDGYDDSTGQLQPIKSLSLNFDVSLIRYCDKHAESSASSEFFSKCRMKHRLR